MKQKSRAHSVNFSFSLFSQFLFMTVPMLQEGVRRNRVRQNSGGLSHLAFLDVTVIYADAVQPWDLQSGCSPQGRSLI